MKKMFVLFTVLLVFAMVGCDHAQKYNDANFFGLLETRMSTKGEFEKAKQKIEFIRELLRELGLTKDVELLELKKERAVDGNFSGGFLSGTSGKIGTQSTVVFRWKSGDGRSFYSELPMTEIVIENTKESPRIFFAFKIFNGLSISNAWWQAEPALLRRNPNALITSEIIFQATIKISEEDIQKYLSFK